MTPRGARAPAASVPADVLRLVKQVELRTRGLVDARFAGEYRSVFKGQGMEFAEVREYQPGDEVRSIDWNVTARMRRPFVRRYVEERELTVLLCVDRSGSGEFGTADRVKRDVAVELAAVLALCAARANDRVGLLLFSDRVEHVVPPRKGRRHALRLVRDVLVRVPAGRGTDLAGALDHAQRLLAHRAIVFILSDFVAPPWERPLRALARRHDVVALPLEDPAERVLPRVGLARFVDPEAGHVVEVDTADPRVRERFAAAVCAERDARRAALARAGVDEVSVRTDRGWAVPLQRFFARRARRAAHR